MYRAPLPERKTNLEILPYQFLSEDDMYTR